MKLLRLIFSRHIHHTRITNRIPRMIGDKPSEPSIMKAKIYAQEITPSASSSANERKPIPIAFISGPLEIDAAYFETHYIPPIKKAIAEGHRFILGPSRGVDTMALKYMRKSGLSPNRIRLYLNTNEETHLKHVFKAFEEAGGSLVMVKGGHTQRDEAMTRASHYDILRYRTEEECRALYGASYRHRVSGTELNFLRRKSGVGLVLPKSQ